MATSVAAETDRLPWLTDDRPARRRRGSRWLFLSLSALVLALVAGLSFWLGMSRGLQPVQGDEAAPSATVALPATPRAGSSDGQAGIGPVPQVELMPQVEPLTQPQVQMPRMEEVRPVLENAPPFRRVASQAASVPRKRHRSSAVAPKARAEPEKRGLQFTNPWESEGASGRMVRIGTYASLQQGKQAWSRLANAFPGIRKLPAVVTDLPSLRNGRVYYRLQVGTTSQAHSEVLCQRMRAIGQSCVVVDVAGARKGKGDDGQPAGL
jgi:hypothetical protein